VYGIFYILSLLPWRIIYILSDGAYFLLYYVFGYRKQVVMGNLLIAFPGKTEAERKSIARQFYKQFADNFLEIIKLISISKEELNKRFTANFDVINNLYNSGVNVQLHSGHFFNWEYANLAYSANIRYPLVVVYMPLTNKIFNRLFLKLRQKFGSNMVAATDFKKDFIPFSKQRYVLALVGDQNPGNPGNAYWTTFFNKLTPIVKGPEKGAKINRTAVVMCNFYPLKRGYYHSEFVLLTTDARSLPDGEITKKMLAYIEDTIRKHPHCYLWSHRRWKWQFDEEKHRKLVI
jgi:KDO2-lipid IV(A) lauroyltransferase